VPDSTSAWAIYAILLRDQAARADVQAALRANGVPTAIYYPRPLHLQPAYRHHHNGVGLPVSEDLANRILALPIHPYLSESDIAHVCDSVLDAVS
jgi:dTDP-4-amino-4,6-dideoxygalactose transaminase